MGVVLAGQKFRLEKQQMWLVPTIYKGGRVYQQSHRIALVDELKIAFDCIVDIAD